MSNLKFLNSIFYKLFVISKDRIIQTNLIEGIGVYVPIDFPSKKYAHIFFQISNELERTHGGALKFYEFAPSWTSVADRFSSMTFADYEFSMQMKKFGIIPNNPSEREIQDTALFSFFINTHSLLESLCYSIYIIGSVKSPNNFPIKPEDLEMIKPELVSKKFNSYFASEQITDDLEKLIKSKEYAEIKMIRNTLIHRTNAPLRRRSYIPLKFKGSPFKWNIPFDSWCISGTIKENSGNKKKKIGCDISLINITSIKRKWILKTFNDLITSTETFVTG